MTALSRIYDANVRIDSTMVSPWSVLQFRNEPSVFPMLSADGQRHSRVLVRPDPAGNLQVRFSTELTGVASVLPISGTQFLQPRAVAQGDGKVEFTHDIEIAPDGTCSQARLRRTHDLPPDTGERPDRFERPLLVQDLLSKPEALRALGQMVDRKLGTGYMEYLGNVDALLGIPKEDTSQVLTLAKAASFAWFQGDALSKAPGISAGPKTSIARAIAEADEAIAQGDRRKATVSIGLAAHAFRATQLEVAQIILDQAKDLLAANSAVKASPRAR
jgi:hypothetical protein